MIVRATPLISNTSWYWFLTPFPLSDTFSAFAPLLDVGQVDPGLGMRPLDHRGEAEEETPASES